MSVLKKVLIPLIQVFLNSKIKKRSEYGRLKLKSLIPYLIPIIVARIKPEKHIRNI